MLNNVSFVRRPQRNTGKGKHPQATLHVIEMIVILHIDQHNWVCPPNSEMQQAQNMLQFNFPWKYLFKWVDMNILTMTITKLNNVSRSCSTIYFDFNIHTIWSSLRNCYFNNNFLMRNLLKVSCVIFILLSCYL